MNIFYVKKFNLTHSATQTNDLVDCYMSKRNSFIQNNLLGNIKKSYKLVK
jgi:hypothetical protein